ncbi:MAG: hypothetical protein Q8P59_00310 [Dehalococcoidia bacterium]|nr:hypothetical protein [Dehalococcoidia bacterium]
MNSSIISKMDKAKRYIQEKGRITFSHFDAEFHGEHDNYHLSYMDGRWNCSCNFFASWDVCSHTMALQKLLSEMLPKGTLPHEISLEPAVPSAH